MSDNHRLLESKVTARACDTRCAERYSLDIGESDTEFRCFGKNVGGVTSSRIAWSGSFAVKPYHHNVLAKSPQQKSC